MNLPAKLHFWLLVALTEALSAFFVVACRTETPPQPYVRSIALEALDFAFSSLCLHGFKNRDGRHQWNW